MRFLEISKQFPRRITIFWVIRDPKACLMPDSHRYSTKNDEFRRFSHLILLFLSTDAPRRCNALFFTQRVVNAIRTNYCLSLAAIIMPELPEVENFRQLLLPLVSGKDPLRLERCTLDKKPPRKFLSDDDIDDINNQCCRLVDVLRKGKLICMLLETKKKTKIYIFVHMGMTGRISTPDYVPELKELNQNDYPPPHTYLKFVSGAKEACFSDPRKFGSILLGSSLEERFNELAPDALNNIENSEIVESLSGKRLGIKALLLDQKKAMCGVGNWVADEVLYQMEMHPDQNYLTEDQAVQLIKTLHNILKISVASLKERQQFPKEWLFHYRWNAKKTTNDFHGRTITFITSGGRTSAIAHSIQKKKFQVTQNATKSTGQKRKVEDRKTDEKDLYKKRKSSPKKHRAEKLTRRKKTELKSNTKQSKATTSDNQTCRRHSPRFSNR